MASAALAMGVANSPLASAYFAALHTPLAGLDVLHWINDGLMALFFLLVGMELKRELLEGALATWPRRMLPGIAAAGGMAVPALIYLAVQGGDAATARGWAIPAATDIAFALGVLSLLGPRVPPSLKVFLAALAIVDDLGAVAIIAVAYTGGIKAWALAGALLALGALVLMNRLKVRALTPYLLVGAWLWWLVLQSGLHATLAGVALGLALPLPLIHRLEHALKPWIAFAVTPVFGFANAGVALAGAGVAALLGPVPLGVAAGLALGKPLGVFGSAWLAIRFGLAERPEGAGWRQLFGVAWLCGIGFTMSLFIGALAFEAPALQDAAKLGVLAGSIVSGLAGWMVLARPRAS
jgi:NhaA family Na+:H+ antiporter